MIKMATIKKITTLLPFTIQDRWYALPVDQVDGVTALAQITTIPGNRSRSVLGLGYMLGQLMTVVDCAPIMNLGVSRNANQAVIVRHEGAYYAIRVEKVGQLIANPRMADFKKPLLACTLRYTDHQKRKITIIDIPKLITTYICT